MPTAYCQSLITTFNFTNFTNYGKQTCTSHSAGGFRAGKNHFAESVNLLKPYCPTLSAEQRQSLPKMSNGTLAFGQQSLGHAVNHPEFLPVHIGLEDWKIDMADVANIQQLTTVLGDLHQLLDDTRLVAGNEAYFAADAVAGAQPIYDELKVHFQNRANKPKVAAQ
ncbi:MAG: hypothetical protein LBU92_05355 [Prevotellaceae bacterium]|jgi:hypothetical protein|nr:hypothetical protein [Prevotellaceae bacterium]